MSTHNISHILEPRWSPRCQRGFLGLSEIVALPDQLLVVAIKSTPPQKAPGGANTLCSVYCPSPKLSYAHTRLTTRCQRKETDYSELFLVSWVHMCAIIYLACLHISFARSWNVICCWHSCALSLWAVFISTVRCSIPPPTRNSLR